MVALKKLDLSLLELPAENLADVKLVTFLRAHGLAVEEIATKLNLSVGRVEAILKSPQVTEDMFRIQRTLNFTFEARLQTVAQIALDEKIKVMLHGKDERTRSAAASDLMDRAKGKAVQTVLSQNINYNMSTVEEVDDNLSQLQARLAVLEEQRGKLKLAQVA
jgi:hypothetical protein